MQVTMDMCSGDVDRDYGTEVMCAEWNPGICAVGGVMAGMAVPVVAQRMRAPEASPSMPPDVAAMDIDAFLRKMYAAQE